MRHWTFGFHNPCDYLVDKLVSNSNLKRQEIELVFMIVCLSYLTRQNSYARICSSKRSFTIHICIYIYNFFSSNLFSIWKVIISEIKLDESIDDSFNSMFLHYYKISGSWFEIEYQLYKLELYQWPTQEQTHMWQNDYIKLSPSWLIMHGNILIEVYYNL